MMQEADLLSITLILQTSKKMQVGHMLLMDLYEHGKLWEFCATSGKL